MTCPEAKAGGIELTDIVQELDLITTRVETEQREVNLGDVAISHMSDGTRPDS